MDTKKLDQETIKILQKLGLTFTQARIYLVLSELGTSSVKIISKTSGIDRAEIYRKIPSLIKLGLIQKILGIPVKFKAIPLKDGLNILLKQESFEHLELQKRTKKLTKKIKEKSKETKQQIENQFNIIPGKKAHINWMKNKFENVQKNVDGILTLNDEKILQIYCEKELQKADHRSVKSRVIIYIPENQRNSQENLETLVDDRPNTEKRIILKCPLVFGGVFDNTDVVIATTLSNPIENAETVFWSNNSSIVALFKNYFEELWKKGKKENHR